MATIVEDGESRILDIHVLELIESNRYFAVVLTTNVHKPGGESCPVLSLKLLPCNVA